VSTKQEPISSFVLLLPDQLDVDFAIIPSVLHAKSIWKCTAGSNNLLSSIWSVTQKAAQDVGAGGMLDSMQRKVRTSAETDFVRSKSFDTPNAPPTNSNHISRYFCSCQMNLLKAQQMGDKLQLIEREDLTEDALKNIQESGKRYRELVTILMERAEGYAKSVPHLRKAGASMIRCAGIPDKVARDLASNGNQQVCLFRKLH
jgi:hypothetical protein